MNRSSRRLLSVGHSYVVALNRRLAHEMARVGGWEVTAVAPEFVRGDLRPVTLERGVGEDCRLEAVPVHGSRFPHVMMFGSRLRRILAAGWDLVHAWEEPYIISGGQIAWWTPPRVPLVFASFQNIAKQYPPPFGWVERFAMSKAAGWIAYGQTIRQSLAARPGYAGLPSRIIPVGVDTEVFRPDPAAGATIQRALGWNSSGPPVVGYLGRFVPEKGLSLLTTVLDGLAVPWRALFVGGGLMEPELRSWAARHGDRVRVITNVRHEQVPAHLNAMDVLCAPSRTTPAWREQLGRMILEAFACGIPVMASNSGEIPHVVASAGLIVPELDVAGWQRELSDLLHSPARRAALSADGRARACEVYSWPVIAQSHLSFFDELLQSPCNRR